MQLLGVAGGGLGLRVRFLGGGRGLGVAALGGGRVWSKVGVRLLGVRLLQSSHSDLSKKKTKKKHHFTKKTSLFSQKKHIILLSNKLLYYFLFLHFPICKIPTYIFNHSAHFLTEILSRLPNSSH